MENFIHDIVNHLESYYDSLVELTPKLLLAILTLLISWFIATRVGFFCRPQTKAKNGRSVACYFYSPID